MKKVDQTGRNTGMARRRRQKNRKSIPGHFIAERRDVLESYPHAAMPLRCHKVLDRIKIEHLAHGGRENGRLPVTFDDFERYGVDRKWIRRAINELVELGFIRITELGRAGNAEFRTPSLYRLTFVHAHDDSPPTDEWKALNTAEAADAALERVAQAHEKQKSSGKFSRILVGKTPLKQATNTPKSTAA